MDVRGYPIGPIDAKGPHLVDQPGMRHKYLPLRHDPATGAISTGDRYLFCSYEDATKYRDFLEAKVFPGDRQPSGSVRSSSTPSGSLGA